MRVKRSQVFTGAGAIIALVAVVLLYQALADGRPMRGRPAVSLSPVPLTSILLDIHGAVIEEFSGDCGSSPHPYLCAYVKGEILRIDKRLLTPAGLTIKTTIDMRMQQAVQQAIGRYVDSGDPQIAAQAVIVPGSGEMRAMATSWGPGIRQGLSQGTTAMVYTLAAALENGMRLEDGFPSTEEYLAPNVGSFQTCDGQNVGDTSNSLHNTTPPRPAGFTTLRSGTLAMVNTLFLRLEEKIGLCETVRMARRLGLARADGLPLEEYEPFTLGFNEVDPVSVANTYATLAARGRHCEPMVVSEIVEPSGFVRRFTPRCEQVLEPAVADAVTDVLSAGLAASSIKGIGRPAAGMPGTGDVSRTAWYAGYTPSLASAVSIGDQRGPVRHPLTDVTIGGRHYELVVGTSIPGLIWKTGMTAAVEGTPETGFVPPNMSRFGGCAASCKT